MIALSVAHRTVSTVDIRLVALVVNRSVASCDVSSPIKDDVEVKTAYICEVHELLEI